MSDQEKIYFGQNLQRGREQRQHAIKQLDELVQSIDEAVSTLYNLKSTAKNTHNNVNGFKTIGTVYSVGGTAAAIGGIFLAPFTAGLSLGLTIGGVTASVAGTTTNIVTSIVDNRLTKGYIEKLESCLRRIEYKMGDAREAMDNYLATLEWFKKAHEIDIDMASILIQKWTNVAEISTGVLRAGKLIDMSTKFYDAVKTMKTVGELTIKGTTSASFTFTKPIAELTKAELEATKFFVNSGGAGWAVKATSKVFNGVFVVLGVGASIWEIYNLVKDWDKNPTAEAVDQSVAKLQEIKKETKKNREAL